jgi:hypothetical protein
MVNMGTVCSAGKAKPSVASGGNNLDGDLFVVHGGRTTLPSPGTMASKGNAERASKGCATSACIVDDRIEIGLAAVELSASSPSNVESMWRTGLLLDRDVRRANSRPRLAVLSWLVRLSSVYGDRRREDDGAGPSAALRPAQLYKHPGDESR